MNDPKPDDYDHAISDSNRPSDEQGSTETGERYRERRKRKAKVQKDETEAKPG